MAKVSVIVPVYNAEKFLNRCIDSIINQTYKDLEIILINDGSKDNSIGVLREYEAFDKRVKVIDNVNCGVSETRNIGVRNSTGKYIQFIDSDDYVEKDMIEKTVKLLEEENADLVITGLFLDIEENGAIDTSIQTFEKSIESGKKSIAKGVLDRLNGTYINSPVNKLFKKDIVVNNNIIMDKNIDLGEDLIFNLEYFRFCNKVVFEEKSYYHYRMQAENNLTFKYRPNKLELMEKLYDKSKSYLDFAGLSQENIEKLNGIFIKWMYSCFLDLHNKSCNLSFSEKYSFIKNNIRKNKNIITNASSEGMTLKVLKLTVNWTLGVYILSKFIYFLKTNARKFLYK